MTTVQQFVHLDPTEEQRWLERFLARELDSESADAFEAYALDKPHLLDQIEADHLLARHLPQAAERADLPLSLPRRRSRGSTPWLALAAGLTLGVVGGWLLRAPAAPEPMHWASPERLVFETVRGAADRRALSTEPGAATSSVVIVDVVLPPMATLTAARLDGPQGELALPEARADRDGVLSLVLERRLLKGAELVLALAGPEGPEEQRIALDAPR